MHCVSKNYTLFIFAITCFIREPIFIIFSSNMPHEIIATKLILYFPPHLIYVLLLYLMYTVAVMSSCARRFF